MAEIQNRVGVGLSTAKETRRGLGSTITETYKSPTFIKDILDLLGEYTVKIEHETLAPLTQGISAGVANVPLSLGSLSHYVDLLHGGAYIYDSAITPYYNPAVQAQLFWVNNPILGFLLQKTSNVDINAVYSVDSQGNLITDGFGNVRISHPSPLYIALPPGAKPEQAEVIINSRIKHRLPKLLSDQEYYLSKEWTSLFFDLSLIGGAFTNFSTNIRTLAQAAESRGPSSGEVEMAKAQATIAKAAEEIG